MNLIKNNPRDFKIKIFPNIIKWNLLNKNNFNVKFFDNKKVINLLKSNNDIRVLKAFNKCKLNNMKGDILKYYLLSKYNNSIYIDANYEPINNINLNNPLIKNNGKLNVVDCSFNTVSNAILSNFNNNNIVFKNILNEAVNNVINNNYINVKYAASTYIVGPELYVKHINKTNHNVIKINNLIENYKIIKKEKLRDPSFKHKSLIDIKEYYN